MVSGNQFSCPQHSLSLFYLPLIGNFPESFLCWILPIFRERERQTTTMFFSNFRKNIFFSSLESDKIRCNYNIVKIPILYIIQTIENFAKGRGESVASVRFENFIQSEANLVQLFISVLEHRTKVRFFISLKGPFF